MKNFSHSSVLAKEPVVKAPLFSQQFILLCISNFLFFGSFNMIIPELPAYLSSLGGADYKGLIISIFTITAGLSRPFSGKLADKVGRIPVMFFGGIVCFVCGMMYPVLGSVLGFLLLRFLHGFSTGFQPTGLSAYIADIVSPNQRGEALGYTGFFSSIGMAAGPAIGSALANTYSVELMFYCSSFAALLSVVILAGMRETLKDRQPFRWKLLRMSRKEVIEPQVLFPSLILMLSVFSFGVILTIIPDFSVYLGIHNKGLFFTYFTLSSLLVRILAGKVSDRFGREKVVMVSCLILAFSMLSIGLSVESWHLLAAAIVFGFGVGISSPTIIAWTVDLSDDANRGKGLATMFIALEIGIGTGAFLSGWLYGNDPAMFPYTFFFAGALPLVAFVLMLKRKK